MRWTCWAATPSGARVGKLARGLRAIMEDTGAVSATLLDQSQAADSLAPGITRRGFAETIHWLPCVAYFL